MESPTARAGVLNIVLFDLVLIVAIDELDA